MRLFRLLPGPLSMSVDVRQDDGGLLQPGLDCLPSKPSQRHPGDLVTIANQQQANLQVLIMDGNYIRRLASDSLSSAGLTHLEGLSLRDCHLTQIAEDALSRLTDLTELKLDRNNLTKLPNKLLAGSPRLEQVSLILNSSSTKKSPSSVNHQDACPLVAKLKLPQKLL